MQRNTTGGSINSTKCVVLNNRNQDLVELIVNFIGKVAAECSAAKSTSLNLVSKTIKMRSAGDHEAILNILRLTILAFLGPVTSSLLFREPSSRMNIHQAATSNISRGRGQKT